VANAQQRYGDGYIRDPKVSAEVIAYRPFFILGEVRDPGQYPYTVGLTALSAVATSQGYTPRANQRVRQCRGVHAAAVCHHDTRLRTHERDQRGDRVK
jgi:polysaccharide export outer membrane protein